MFVLYPCSFDYSCWPFPASESLSASFVFITLCESSSGVSLDSSIYRCPGCLFKWTVPCWPQRGECEWKWVWPRCGLLPSLCRNIYSWNSSPLLPHSCVLPPPPPPSLPSSSSSRLSWSCPSQSSKPLDPSSCSGCSGWLWCDRRAHAPPLALAPPLRLWPGGKPATAGRGTAWSR